jgi:hypothetical protein
MLDWRPAILYTGAALGDGWQTAAWAAGWRVTRRLNPCGTLLLLAGVACAFAGVINQSQTLQVDLGLGVAQVTR